VKRTAWAWARRIGGAAILGILVVRLGTGTFLAGLRAVDAQALLAVTAITAGTTVCSAWRWRVVARGLGVGLPMRAAIGAYYRSQFLNSALPGGVAGDVHRGIRHGQGVGDIGRGLRSVVWERVAGQVVQAALTALVLLAVDSPVRPVMPWVLTAAVVAALSAALGVRLLPQRGASRGAAALRAARADVRDGLLARRAWPGVTAASAIVVAGHTGNFLVAAATTGSGAPMARLWPLAMLTLLAMSVPLTLGGWGPREGVAAWAFGAAGLGAAQGVAMATAYGVLTLAATLPGALVLVADRFHRAEDADAPGSPGRNQLSQTPVLAGARSGGGAHG
jgi:hypothetical protein